MSRFEPIWNTAAIDQIRKHQQEFWKGDRFDSATPKEQISAKAIDEFLDMLRKDKQSKDALNFIEAMRLQNLIRTKVSEIDKAELPQYCSEAMELDYERRPPFPCYLWDSSGGYWAYFRNDPFPYMLGSKEAYTHWMAPPPPPPPRKRKEAPAWKPVDLDNPPTCPVLVRHDDESTPFVASQWFDWFHGWEYCEIPD